jgi:hypothetical protein
MPTETQEPESVDVLEAQYRANQIKMDLRVQEAQFKQLDRALALEAGSRSFGSAGPQETMEGLYAPEDYIDIEDYRRDNYGYQAYAATFTTKTDRQDGRNWPYWTSEAELAAIRGTVRLLAAYNKTTFGVLNKLRDYVVGKTGFTRKAESKRDAPKELLDAITNILDEFDELNSVTGGSRSAELPMDQEGCIRHSRDGELFIGLWHRGEGRVEARMVEPDQVSEPTNPGGLEDWLHSQDDESGLGFVSNWSYGIHTTAGDVGSKHGYYVQWDGSLENWDYMPGGNQPCYPPADGGNKWMCLLKANTDRNIKRGVSDFWPVTGDVELARKMIRNLTHAGALQAAIAWIRELAPGTTQSQVNSATMSTADWSTRTATQNGGVRTSYQQTYQPGTSLYLGANQKFVPPPWVQQSMAAGLVAIYEAMLRSVAQIWSMPEHMITGNAGNNNYASILEAGSPFVKHIETRQSWHVGLWKEVYWKVLWFNWKIGRLGNYAWSDIRRAVDVMVTPQQVDVRDRMKETQRGILLLDAGIISPVELGTREGVDYDEQVKQGAKPRQDPISAVKAVGASGMGKSKPMSNEGAVPQETDQYESLAKASKVDWRSYP